MVSAERNIHATAVALGDKGYLLVGPSGSGKTSTALALMAAADRANTFAALVADDQVMVANVNGRILARCPDTIRGLAEVRYSNIVRVRSIGQCVLHCAVRVISDGASERLAPENAWHEIDKVGRLPLLHLPRPAADHLFLLEHLFDACHFAWPIADR